MDRLQIALKLGMDFLEIPISGSNYRTLCNAVYLAEQRGIYLSPSRIELDANTGLAYSPKSHEYSGCLSWNLLDDIEQIEFDVKRGFDPAKQGWTLDEASLRRLLKLKEDIAVKGLNQLVLEAC